MPPPTEAQIHAALDDLRSAGFFSSRRTDDTQSLLHAIRSSHGSDWEDLCRQLPSPAALDQLLLWYEQERVWSRGLEAVYPGEDAYAAMLRGLAAISRGQFAPVAVSETWASASGPLLLSYTVDRVAHQFVHRDGLSDHLDLRLVQQVNASVKRRNIQFAPCDDFLPDGNFIVALTPKELHDLRTRRGWHFCTWLLA